MRSLAPERRPFDDRADDHTVGSIVKGNVPKREGPTTDVGLLLSPRNPSVEGPHSVEV